MPEIVRDVRYAFRSLRRSPGLTVAALLALGLGVGATAAIYTVIDAVLIEPLPYPEPDELVVLLDANPEAGFPRFSSSPPNYADWKEQQTTFDALAAFSRSNLVLNDPGVEPERIDGASMSHELLPLLGVEPLHGRVFRPEEDVPGAEPVAILGHDLFRRRFGGDPGVVGTTTRIGGEDHRIVGVMPEGFSYPPGAELFVPLALEIDPNQRGAHYIAVLGRIEDGVSFDEAQAEIQAIAARLEAEYPDANTGWTVNLVRSHDLMVENVRPVLRVLAWAVVAVLLVVCANVANLLLVRASRREREMAVRTALGAGRGRLAVQLLTETAVLALGGGLLGLLFGLWGTRALVAMNADDIPRSAEIGLDPSVFLFTLAVALGAGLVAGLAPVLHASRGNLQGSLKEGTSAAGEGSRARWVRRGLVLAELGFAVVLLIAAGLLIRSLVEMSGVSPGFEPEGAMTAQLSLPEAAYPDDAARVDFYRRLNERLDAIPGVTTAGIGFPLPMGRGNFFLAYSVQGRPVPAPQDFASSGIRMVRPGYLDAMGIPLLAGRRFTDRDRADQPRVAIVSQALVDREWPGGDPLGERITFNGPDAAPEEWMEVVGVVGSVRHRELASDPDVEIYVPMDQAPFTNAAAIVLRTDGDPETLAEPIRQAVRAIDPSLPVYGLGTLEDVVAGSMAGERFSATLLGVFAGLALVLASLGVYGVLSYAVAQRTREMGLRMALGAERDGVLKLVLRQGMGLVVIGIGAGIVVALFATRFLRSMLYEVEAFDPLTYVAVPVALALVGLLATLIPALRATKVDPLVALKSE
jgi:putative ABC transport system permease protein